MAPWRFPISKEGFSRRSFLRDVAASSTGAALVSLPAVAHATRGEEALEPPWPVTVESYPLVEPGKAPRMGCVKLATTNEIPAAYREKLRAYAPNLELALCRDEEELRREVADAHVIYGWFTREILQAARQLRWIQYSATGVEDILYPELVDSPIVLTNMQIITSHSSGVSEGSTQRCYDLLCENVRRYVNGLPLLNVVDKKRGY